MIKELETHRLGNILKRTRQRKSALIAGQIRDGISKGLYSEQLPASIELAREFSVNKNTIDKALRTLIERGEIVRVQGKGTYIAGMEPFKKAGPRKKSRRYAFIIDGSDFFSGYLRILDVCDEEISKLNGTTIFVQFSRTDPVEKLLGRLRSRQIEGVFACGLIGENVIRVIKKEFNLVLIDYKGGKEGANMVVWNNFEAARETATMLLSCLPGNFTCLQAKLVYPDGSVSVSPNYAERLDGFKSALEEKNADFEVFSSPWSFSDASLNERMAKRLSRGGVLLSPSYELALQALIKLNLTGLLGSKLKLGTFVNSHGSACLPKGVYAVLDIDKCARAAASLLLGTIGRPFEKYRSVVVGNEYLEI